MAALLVAFRAGMPPPCGLPADCVYFWQMTCSPAFIRRGGRNRHGAHCAGIYESVMCMKKQTIVTILIAAVTFVLGIVCYLVLPDQVSVQWSITGEVTNTLPKIFAILVSWGLTALLLAMGTGKKSWTNTLFGCIGILSLGLYLVMNA